MDLEIGYGEALQFGVKRGIYTRRGSLSELETLRQRVADLETLLVSSTQKQVELTSERDALIKQRDDLLAALERVSLELGIDGLLPEWEFVDEAIASVKEKS